MTTLEHGIQGKPNLRSKAKVTHMWVQNKLEPVSWVVTVVSLCSGFSTSHSGRVRKYLFSLFSYWTYLKKCIRLQNPDPFNCTYLIIVIDIFYILSHISHIFVHFLWIWFSFTVSNDQLRLMALLSTVRIRSSFPQLWTPSASTSGLDSKLWSSPVPGTVTESWADNANNLGWDHTRRN